MKHLRKFNESLKDELQDFCETNLAYLIDKGFVIRISKFKGDDFHQIIIGTPHNYMLNRLWFEMKDHILPFLHFLFKDYESYWDNGVEPPMGILSVRGRTVDRDRSIKQTAVTLEQLNELPDNTEISSLFIRVVKRGSKESLVY